MGSLTLRDHAERILLATVDDMQSVQTNTERSARSRSHGSETSTTDTTKISSLDEASEAHAIDRLGSGFDLLEVVSEYRALRASVLRLWRDSEPDADERDVEDVTRFNESLDQSIAKTVSSYTKRVDQSRDMFLAILGHDLRNPLNSIAMSASLIPRIGHPEPEAVSFATQICSNAVQMGRMIGDLLDYTRTRLGAGMPVEPAPMDLKPLCRGLFDEFRTAHPKCTFRFFSEGDGTGDWDADRVRQAISNLLGNAVQHGDASAPIELRLTGVDNEVSVAIHNGGSPIPPGELAKIFDPLVRGSSGDHPVKNRPGSIGLGLYIAREVAKSHGGSIEVVSTRDAGTNFTIRLPRQSSVSHGQPILDTTKIQTM
ncbi:HAMP domain-containing histidine kinase [Humisphaera borealis]|uniref:histidine kinase n=2 Tax=Humisphaera borealis TaxID=2807512 RepID=A0A7M2WXE5_9BACT|nr:HAMP domain-containing histidine kinase [Humisphaera borealis]